MACFLACFGFVGGKRRKPRKKAPSRDRRHTNHDSLSPSFSSPVEQQTKTKVADSSFSRDEQGGTSYNGQEKVSFNLDVKTCDVEIPAQKVQILSSETKEEGEQKEKSKNIGEVNHLALSQDYPANSRFGSFPSSHRYDNDATINNGDEDYPECDFTDEKEGSSYDIESYPTLPSTHNEDLKDEKEESSFDIDSYHTLPVEKVVVSPNHSAKNDIINFTNICGLSNQEHSLLASNGNARDQSRYIHPVLKPVENLSSWRAMKGKPISLKHSKKENVGLEQELNFPFCAKRTFKGPNSQKPMNSSKSFNFNEPFSSQEIHVDASLSNRLASSEPMHPAEPCTPLPESSEMSWSQRSSSVPKNCDDRPILGALVVEELKHSLFSSPTKLPSRSPDDCTPNVGSVVGHWNRIDVVDALSSPRSGSGPKGIPNTTSKYREDKKVNWHNTPFEERLERVLKNGGAPASCPP